MRLCKTDRHGNALNNCEFTVYLGWFDLTDVNYEWFLRADLEKFRGLYVAVVDGRVVESGERPEKVHAKAREKFPEKEVVLWKVPREEALIL